MYKRSTVPHYIGAANMGASRQVSNIVRIREQHHKMRTFLIKFAFIIGVGCASNALVLPAGSVRLNDGEPHVYTVENDTVKRLPVTLGNDNGILIEITSGLTGGEQIVANSLGRLRDGDAVTVKSRN